MKKILVVFLVLAVSTGVFAQGWGAWGTAQFGTSIDLLDHYELGVTAAHNNAQASIIPWDGWSSPHAELGLSYSDGGFFAGFGFNTKDFLSANAGFNGENYFFKGVAKFNKLLTTADSVYNVKAPDWYPDGELYGWYKFANEMIRIEGAYSSPDLTYFVSDITGAFGGNPRDLNLGSDGGAYAHVAAWLIPNYLLVDFNISNLEFGLLLPLLFSDTPANFIDSYAINPATGNKDPGILKQSVFGVKFNMSPVEFAAQLSMNNYGVYLGLVYSLGVVDLGLSFMGKLSDPDEKRMKAGIDIKYNAGGFGIDVKGILENKKLAKDGALPTEKAGDGNSIIGVEPKFFYNVIPTHLQFNVMAGFYFDTVTANAEKGAMETYWGVQPELVYNFRGDGATDDPGTGLRLRYKMFQGVGVKKGNDFAADDNALSVAFKWSM